MIRSEDVSNEGHRALRKAHLLDHEADGQDRGRAGFSVLAAAELLDDDPITLQPRAEKESHAGLALGGAAVDRTGARR